MRHIGAILLILFVVPSSLFFIDNAYAQDDVYTTGFEDKELAVGDYIELTIETDDYSTGTTGNSRMEVSSLDDEITVKGTTYTVYTILIYGEYYIDGSYGFQGNITFSGTIYFDTTTDKIVKQILSADMSLSYQRETTRTISNIVNIPINESSTLGENSKIRIGDTWTVEVVSEKTETVTTIHPDGEEETTTETDIETEEINYEYIREETITGSTGTHNCIVIKNTDPDDYLEDYTLTYTDKELGLPVKHETYDRNDLCTGTTELSAYKFKNLGISGGVSVLSELTDKEDPGFFGFGKVVDMYIIIFILIILTLLVIVSVSIITIKAVRKSFISSEVQYPLIKDDEIPQQLQKPPIPYLPCPLCGQSLSFVEQYNKWYCSSCHMYHIVDILPNKNAN